MPNVSAVFSRPPGFGKPYATTALPRTSRPLKVRGGAHPDPDRLEIRLAVGADGVIQRKRGLQRERLAAAAAVTSHDVGHHCGGQVGEFLHATSRGRCA